MRRSVRCEPGRMHPGPIQTTRHVTDASRVTRLGGRARRTGTVASRQENFAPSRNADVSLTPLFAPVVGRRRRCHHRPHGVPRVRRHHQARRRQRRARLLRKCPLPPLALPPHARSPEADRRGIPQKSTLTRQLQGDARHFLARVVFCLGFSSRLRRARVFPPPAFFGENTKPKNSPLSRLSIRTTAQQDHRRQG